MPKCVLRNRDFLQKLLTCKPKDSKKLIKGASKDNIDALSEVALNTLLGNVPLQEKQKKKLKRYHKKIRFLARKRTSARKKKKFLVQQGGFLPLLLTPILSTLGGLAAQARGSAVGI
jgi:hypothetical protein